MITLKKYTPEWWASLPPEDVGGETEKVVEALFKQMNQRQSFAWHRLPDAKASRGRVNAQPADYTYRSGKYAGFIEVKALKHLFRLPAARLTQLPTLQKWALAGSDDVILVHHYMSGQWRSMAATELKLGETSWDLTEFEPHGSAGAALAATGYFDG